MWKLTFLIVCSCHVTYAFQSESTLYCCLNIKELLAWSRPQIWRLSDYNWTRTQNHLVRKRTLNHLARKCLFTNEYSCSHLYFYNLSRVMHKCLLREYSCFSVTWFLFEFFGWWSCNISINFTVDINRNHQSLEKWTWQWTLLIFLYYWLKTVWEKIVVFQWFDS